MVQLRGVIRQARRLRQVPLRRVRRPQVRFRGVQSIRPEQLVPAPDRAAAALCPLRPRQQLHQGERHRKRRRRARQTVLVPLLYEGEVTNSV